MRSFVTILFAVVATCSAQQHQQVDPAYLRQYYAQIAEQTGAEGGQRAAPIYETQEQPEYLQQAKNQFPRQQQQQQAYVQEPQQHQARQYQQQPQQVQYQQPKAQAQAKPKRPQYQPEEESPEDYDPNPNYQFGFDVKDDEFTNYQNRKESREGNVIKGSYSVVDSDGFIRTVSYTADPKEGFKAEVVREPTDIVIKVPIQQNQQEPQQQKQQLFRQAAPAAKQSQPQYVASPQQHQQYRPQQQQQQARPEYSQYQQ